jgi:limonene-1,2-epoxide hydrolase
MRFLFPALALALAGCATPEPPAISLERANILPLELNTDFQFRKVQQFFNDPRNYAETVSETVRFERRRLNFGAITPRDYDERTGNFFSFHWRARREADVTIRLEYRQANLGNYVLAQERYYPAAKGSKRSDFTVTGDEYFENGRVTAWRVLLVVDGRIVAFRQSFLWK